MDHFPKSWTGVFPCDLGERCGILQQEPLTDCGDTGQLSGFQSDCRSGCDEGPRASRQNMVEHRGWSAR